MNIFLKIVGYLLGVVVLFFGILYVMSRMEVTAKSWDSYDELAKTFNGGWIPSWLPKSATNIKESHKIDSNRTWLVFNYSNENEFDSIPCVSIEKEKTVLPMVNKLHWYPDFVANIYGQFENNSSLVFFYCEEIGRISDTSRYLAIDKQQAVAYIWIP